MTETTTIHPALARLIEAGRTFTEARGITVATEGNSIVWSRAGWTLAWRSERQALPGGACPLAMQDDEGEYVAFCGQRFTREEAVAFLAVTSGGAVVFENDTRTFVTCVSCGQSLSAYFAVATATPAGDIWQCAGCVADDEAELYASTFRPSDEAAQS